MAARGEKVVLADRDFKQGKTVKYGSDGAVKMTTSQQVDERQAKKLWEGCKESVGDISPLQPLIKPEPIAASSDSPTQLGGQGSQTPQPGPSRKQRM